MEELSQTGEKSAPAEIKKKTKTSMSDCNAKADTPDIRVLTAIDSSSLWLKNEPISKSSDS